MTRLIKRVAEALTKGYCRHLVEQAYAHPAGEAHQRIMAMARDKYAPGVGYNFYRRLVAGWGIDFILHVRREICREGCSHEVLPAAPIGFGDLCIKASCRDSNSSFVYLLGFTDNTPAFALLQRYVLPGTVAVDVGANIGMHSLVMSRCAGMIGQVVAFEPLAGIRERFKANMGLNGVVNVELRALALAGFAGHARFDPNAGDFNIGKGHLSAQGSLEVAVSTLDQELAGEERRVSFIKIDVEGHELEALGGGREILSRHKPVLLVEFNPQDYSFDALRTAVPYPARFFKVPVLGDGLLQEIVHAPAGGDLLVLPQ